MAERRRRSLRTRITLIAAGVVAVVLACGALAFHAVLSTTIRDGALRAAETRLDELAARVESAGAGLIGDLDDEFVQVIDGDAVVASSEDAAGVAIPGVSDGSVIEVDGEQMLVISESVGDGRELRMGVPLEDDTETLGTTAALLAVSVPLVVLVVAGVTWWVVGRALQPVERVRRQVDAITGERLGTRVAVPDSADEIAALTQTMNRMLDRLDASATAQRRFVSDASHELRSPLATIRQHAELARAHPEVTSASELAGVVHEEGLRMQGLVDALLLLARLDEHAPSRSEPVDLDDLAWTERERLRASGVVIDGSGISAARTAGDPRLLSQLVRNLTDNAARHARSRMALATFVRDGWAVLTVDDDGAGVPPNERERVFERFVRLDEARARDGGGSGLGLAIARGIASASGGTVTLTGSPVGGARLVVALPAAS